MRNLVSTKGKVDKQNVTNLESRDNPLLASGKKSLCTLCQSTNLVDFAVQRTFHSFVYSASQDRKLALKVVSLKVGLTLRNNKNKLQLFAPNYGEVELRVAILVDGIKSDSDTLMPFKVATSVVLFLLGLSSITKWPT